MKPPPTEEAEEWAAKVEQRLRAPPFDTSYVALFRSGAGINLGATMIASDVHARLSTGLQIRIFRLQEFLQEIPPPV